MTSTPEAHAGTPCDLRLRDATTAGRRRTILGDAKAFRGSDRLPSP